MTDMEVVMSLNNAWSALAHQYSGCQDEGIRCGINLLAKVIRKVRREVEESHRETQVTLEEWVAMLQEGDFGGKGKYEEIKR